MFYIAPGGVPKFLARSGSPPAAVAFSAEMLFDRRALYRRAFDEFYRTFGAAFYDARIPASVYGTVELETWRKTAERETPKLLFLSRGDLMRHDAAGITTESFPPALESC